MPLRDKTTGKHFDEVFFAKVANDLLFFRYFLQKSSIADVYR